MSRQAPRSADGRRVAWGNRFIPLLLRMRAGLAGGRFQRESLLVATVVLAAGLFIALQRLPSELGLTRPGLLALSAIVGVPLAVLLTVIETWLSARIVSVGLGWFACLRLSVLASAANMLPLPGGPLVRVSVLRQAGARLTETTVATVLVAVSWLGVALLFAAFSALQTMLTLATVFAAIGGVLIALSVAGLYYVSRSWTLVGSVLLIKCAIVVVDLYRMKWALGALDVDVGMRENAVFAVAGVAGAAISFVPAGLGITEAAAALVAPIGNVPSSAAFLAAALNRAIAMATMLPLGLAVSMAWVPRRR